MKRILMVILCMLLFFVSGCSFHKKENQSADPVPSETAQATETEENDETAITEENDQNSAAKETQDANVPTVEKATPAPSTNKTVVTAEKGPEIFWVSDTVYHLKNCSELKGKEPMLISWEMAQTMGLRQCPICNPPQYENYIE